MVIGRLLRPLQCYHIPSEFALEYSAGSQSTAEQDGLFIHSNWQFLNSEKLRARIQDWSKADLSASDVDSNDYLLDWRSGGEACDTSITLMNELEELAMSSNFRVVDTFYSDGEGGRLGLYQVWKPV